MLYGSYYIILVLNIVVLCDYSFHGLRGLFLQGQKFYTVCLDLNSPGLDRGIGQCAAGHLIMLRQKCLKMGSSEFRAHCPEFKLVCAFSVRTSILFICWLVASYKSYGYTHLCPVAASHIKSHSRCWCQPKLTLKACWTLASILWVHVFGK